MKKVARQTNNWRGPRYWAIALLLVCCLAVDVSFADEVPSPQGTNTEATGPRPKPHLVGMAKDLLGQLDEKHFADPAVGKKVLSIIKKSRMRSWSGKQPDIADFTADLEKRFELFPLDNLEHHEALQALLNATTLKGKKAAVRRILQLNGGLKTARANKQDENAAVDEALRSHQKYLGEKYELLQQRTEFEVGDDGDKIAIEWDTENGDLLVKVKPGDKNEEYLIQGGVAIKRGDVGIHLTPKLDEVPIQLIDAAKRRQISQAIFGEWRSQDGDRWIIGRGETSSMSASDKQVVDPVQARLGKLRAELKEVKAKKVFVWINADTGKNVIQNSYKRLKDPYVFMKQESKDFYKDKITRLEDTINELQATENTLPVDKIDPLNLQDRQDAGNAKPGTIKVIDTGGYEYTYGNVSYDGKRLTARRTLLDLRDIRQGHLPEHIRQELISNWSPPEWIELSVKYRPRTNDFSLEGDRWRLHVTHSAISGSVSRIDTPYVEKKLQLEMMASKGEPKAVSLRFLFRRDGKLQAPQEPLKFGQPFFVELVFDRDSASGNKQVLVSVNGQQIQVNVSPTAEDPKRFLSNEVIVEAQQAKDKTK